MPSLPANTYKDSMKILITGSTGLVGTALTEGLQRAGDTVCRLVRPGTSPGSSQGFDVNWNPATGELGGAAVGADAVVNLSGASIADGRWTPQRKQLLRDSRVNTTRALVQALAKMSARPRVLVSASATGYYGNRGDETLTESSEPGNDFLSGIAKEWESEALKAEALGIRVVRARFGVILSKQGGALLQMMRPFQFFVGGKIGPGNQWMSWITLNDTVAILRLALENANITGALNVVSPQPVTNADFTKILAAALHRPTVFPAPAFALHLILGEMADALLLSSQRVQPAQLQKLNYQFIHPDLAEALTDILK
ncbi:MAG TPA: TIGR01777 family oxidoreductase [Candidatus Acidoferrum sp.]|nr:TIGR01777 family oxidoreductase [Candidatus Acidoferrum sp.]